MIFYLKYYLYLYGFAHISLVNSLAGTQKKAGPTDSRKGRMFNVLEVVRFPNDACTTGNENTSGVCYTATECSALGGAMGSACASGFGVCCTFSVGCDSSVKI